MLLAIARLPAFFGFFINSYMREDHPVSRSSDLPQWIFLGVLMSLILLAASLGTPNSDVSARVAKHGQQEKLTDLQLLQRQVDAGDPEAQRLMALRCRDGVGVLRSAAETTRLLELSISGGNVHAMYDLACLYDGGMPGVAADDEKAWDLYLKSAEHGHVNGAAYVSEALSFGVGVVKDNHLVEAYAWRSVVTYLHEHIQDASFIIINMKGRRGFMNIDMDDATYASGGAVHSTTLWLRRLEKRLSVQGILEAQKRSRELLTEIEAKKAKK